MFVFTGAILILLSFYLPLLFYKAIVTSEPIRKLEKNNLYAHYSSIFIFDLVENCKIIIKKTRSPFFLKYLVKLHTRWTELGVGSSKASTCRTTSILPALGMKTIGVFLTDPKLFLQIKTKFPF